MLENVKNLLSDGVTALGGILIVFGLVNLGLTIKDGMQGGGGQLSGALAMIIGGAIVVGAAVYFKTGINWGSLAGYWYAPGEYALRVYTVDTLNTNFARPCFAFGERTSDPEMEDVSGAIENTLHELLDSGATPEDVYRIMGLVKESELSPETKEADSYLPIDLGYCIDGNIVSYEAVPEGVATVPENVDYPRYAEAMESHVPLPIATQIAKHDFSHRQADILMEAARSPHVSSETLETIADKTLSSGKMRGLLDIASVGKNPLDFRNMDEQTLKAAVSVLFHGGKDLPVTELGLAQLRSVDLALMDGASPAEAMRAAEKSASAEPEAPAASLASEARDAKAARTELDSQSETKDAPTRAEKADGSL